MFEFNHHMQNNSFGLFGSTVANPKISSALGIAAATSMPIFGGGYGFCNGYSFGPFNNIQALNTQPIVTTNPQFNNINWMNNTNNYFNQTSNNTNNNSFGYFNNLNNIKIIPSAYGNFNTLTQAHINPNGSISFDTTQFTTSGVKINRKGNGYGPEFLAKVKQIAQRLNCDYRDLLALMNSESGINAHQWCTIPGEEGKAVGLIQFRDETARTLGTSLTALANMSPIEQLDYVEKYFQYWIDAKHLNGKRLSAGDLYTLTYTPAYAGKEVLSRKGEKFYDKNRGLDVNGDGTITTGDLAQQIQRKRVSDNSFLA